MHAILPGFSEDRSVASLLTSLSRRCRALWSTLFGLRRRRGYRPERSYMGRDR